MTKRVNDILHGLDMAAKSPKMKDDHSDRENICYIMINYRQEIDMFGAALHVTR